MVLCESYQHSHYVIIVTLAHVLVHCVKSIRAYNVKSSSTLFSDNIQWNFRISFCWSRFNSQFGDNLIIESWDYGKQDFFRPCVIKLEKIAFICDTLIWKRFISALNGILYISRLTKKLVFQFTNFKNLCPTWNHQCFT